MNWYSIAHANRETQVIGYFVILFYAELITSPGISLLHPDWCKMARSMHVQHSIDEWKLREEIWPCAAVLIKFYLYWSDNVRCQFI